MNTIQEMFGDRLAKLDRAWQRIRDIHADIEHCNSESKLFREALENLGKAERELWRLKNVVADNR